MEKTLEQVQEVLKKVEFAPSCLNLDYQWEVKETQEGFLIRCSFTRPETYSGEVGRGFGRWMHIGKTSSDSAIVKTAWLCLELVVKHELLEGFMYRGVRIFNPHKSCKDLAFPQEYKF